MPNEDQHSGGDRRIDPIEYGKLLAQVAHLTKTVENMQTMQKSTDDNVQAMRNLMEQAKGGWKTLAWLGGISGTVGGVVAWAVNHIKVS